MAGPISRGKQLLFSAIITVVMLALLLLVLEVGIGRYLTAEESGNPIEFHPLRGWALKPGEYQVKPINRFASFEIRIDDLGLRSLNRGGADHVDKLLVLGDSFTFAREVATETMFTQQLQNRLDESGAGIQVLNAGVPAYGTAQQLMLMEELQSDRHVVPGLVLLVFFTNDILDNLCLSYGDLNQQHIRPCYGLDAGHRPVLQSRPIAGAQYSGDDTLVPATTQQGFRLKSLTAARNLAEGWLQAKPGIVRLLTSIGLEAQVARRPGLLNGWYRDDVLNRGVPLTAALIAEINRRVRAHDGRLAVTMVPSPFQVYSDTYLPLLRQSFAGDPTVEAFASDMERPQRLMRQICADLGIPFHDLLPVFAERADTALFVPRDGHLNEAGHVVAGADLFEFVRTQHWVASR
jgi:hypothetical protein